MDVKPGYKQTEVGVIPEDWDVKALGDMTLLMTNGFVGTATSAYVETDDGVLYVQGYNVEPNGFNFHGMKRVSRAFHARNAKSCLKAGDLLTIQTGDIGVTSRVPPELEGANCHALIISRFEQCLNEPGYYSQLFNSDIGRAAFKSIETGSTMKHLNVGDMVKVAVPIPPISEQRAIASALSDVDALIAKLDQFIAKKREIKQAAMQELLTGRRRLPGFQGEWTHQRLGDIGATYGGLTGKSKSDFGSGSGLYITFLNVIQNVIIDCNTFERVKVLPHESQNRVLAGDILLNGSSETPEEVGLCSVLQADVVDLYLNSFCIGFRLRDCSHTNGLFLAYFLRCENGRELMKSLAQGSTRFNLSKAALLKSTVPLPSFPEQTAIAAVLSDMDAEITALEARRDKTKLLKQGMMQELLTGRIRLV